MFSHKIKKMHGSNPLEGLLQDILKDKDQTDSPSPSLEPCQLFLRV